MLVVHSSCVVVGKNLVGAGDVLEFDVGILTLLFRDFVGVGGERGFVVGLLDFGLAGAFRYGEDLCGR